jgi:hypothetical protein
MSGTGCPATKGDRTISYPSRTKSLLERAQRFQERKQTEARLRRTEEERLIRCCRAIEALKKATYAMRCAIDLANAPPSATEMQEHNRVVAPLLADVLTALDDADLRQRLKQLDETATLAHYRQARDDPQESQLAYAYARQIIATKPTDRKRLAHLVQHALNPGLWKAWDWVYILLDGLSGQQKLVWKQKPAEGTIPTPSPPVQGGTGKGGECVLDLTQRQCEILQTLYGRGATDREERMTTEQIAKSICPFLYSASLKEPISKLSALHLIATKTGRGGGCWLTPEGLSVIREKEKRRHQRNKKR